MQVDTKSSHGLRHVSFKKKTVDRMIHTLNDPLINDTRFLQTGSRISIQFRLRAAALALAQAKAG